MKKVFIIILLLFITNLSFAQQKEWSINAGSFGGINGVEISQKSDKKYENLVLYYNSMIDAYGFISKKSLNVFQKLKSETIIAKIEFTFANNQKSVAEGVLTKFDGDVLLNLTTANRKEIFKKIFQEQVVAVKIILSAPFLKNDETIIMGENYDFRKAYKELTPGEIEIINKSFLIN